MSQEISKVYTPSEIEQKWYGVWEEGRLFTPQENTSLPSFTIVIPPPNVTGNLHMGHALDNSIQDVLIRYKKMQGFNALWVPGTDHAGIATQNVVVKALRAEGTTKEQLGREKFIERVWQWKEEYGGNITRQLRRLGCALDWTRERFTMDAGLSKAVTHEFVSLYNAGLIYRGKRLVNWCPKCGTAISDIEVEHEAQKGKLWYIKYQIVDSRKSSVESRNYIVVATTRPETMLGDTAVAVNPHDKRYHHLIGKMLILPLVNRKIPVIADEYVDAGFGTGAVKVTPAHDPNDFEMGERHDLPRVNILDKTAKITLEELEENERKGVKEIEGLERFKARERLVEMLEEGGYIERIEDYENTVGVCYRCKSVIEPYLSDQWYVRTADLARAAIRVVEEGKIKFIPERWTKIYIDWMVNLKDWCISRQLWWGHRIPAYYCKSQIPNPKSQINCKSQNTKENFCNAIIVSEEKPTHCPKCGGSNLEQDPDVFDTWFSSALWPFSTLGWPDRTTDLKTFYPTDVLVTGYDIIAFWVSRMIMMGVHFMGKEPFHTVFIHGLVRDAQGKKMSKSFGNVIDPLGIIDEVGADALRFALISLISGQGQDIKLTKEKLTEARNFCNKIWNAARFVLQTTAHSPQATDPKEWGLAERWIISRYNQTVKTVTLKLENYEFGDAARTLYDFIWGEFCDWYLEIAKIAIYSLDASKKQDTAEVLFFVLEGVLKLLHPFMPFITEEIGQQINARLKMQSVKLGTRDTEQRSLLLSSWPKAEENKIDEAAEEEMRLLMETITKIRNIKAEMGVQTKDIAVVFEVPEVGEREVLRRGEALIKSLAKTAKMEIMSQMPSKPAKAASGMVGGLQFFVPLEGLIDIEKEIARLQKEQRKLEEELHRLQGLLSKEDFIAKAPPETVEKQRMRVGELEEKLKIFAQRVNDLN